MTACTRKSCVWLSCIRAFWLLSRNVTLQKRPFLVGILHRFLMLEALTCNCFAIITVLANVCLQLSPTFGDRVRSEIEVSLSCTSSLMGINILRTWVKPHVICTSCSRTIFESQETFTASIVRGYDSKATPGKNQNLFATLTVRT